MRAADLAPLVRELGRTEGGPRTVAVLTAQQRARRLLLLRLLWDAVDAAEPRRLPPAAAARAREHGRLLEAADRADTDATRRVLYYPLAGPWLERCVRALTPDPRPAAHPDPDPALEAAPAPTPAPQPAAHPDPDRPPTPPRELDLLGPLAVAAAARAGVGHTTRLTVHSPTLVLPTLGGLRVAHGGPVTVRGEPGRLTLEPPGEAPLRIRRDAMPGGGWRSADPRWTPVAVLSGGARPVLLDDLDGGRTVGGDLVRYGVRVSGVLSPAERDRWRRCWEGALGMLRLGGPARTGELALLSCLVPLDRPGESGRQRVTSHSSGTRRDAFGAVLASTPPNPALLAACLVHELQHAKLAALSDLVPLHTADGTRRYWAPWRTDPRPFDGLLHGAYAHLALADHWQRLARALADPLERDRAWAEHSRCREQVGAVLPTLLGTHRLTPPGRVFLGEMSALHARMARHPPPEGHRARATAYVETARAMWRRQHGGLGARGGPGPPGARGGPESGARGGPESGERGGPRSGERPG